MVEEEEEEKKIKKSRKTVSLNGLVERTHSRRAVSFDYENRIKEGSSTHSTFNFVKSGMPTGPIEEKNWRTTRECQFTLLEFMIR